jgi:hypothetical protein
VVEEDGMLNHHPTEDNLCPIRVTVKCQQVLVVMDVVNLLPERDGTRPKARLTVSAMATQAIKAKNCILPVMLKINTDATDGGPSQMVCKSKQACY